ncbi:hypothetical protein GAY30_27220 [Azospirillum brasilense]|nr:hypothetical protein [Azospirillum brasilense]NUB35686.1 hypothetical protein [Azospirillum brasilense]RIV96719.1 hypothetical protein D2T81_30690 [Azospirillum brasilense]
MLVSYFDAEGFTRSFNGELIETEPCQGLGTAWTETYRLSDGRTLTATRRLDWGMLLDVSIQESMRL